MTARLAILALSGAAAIGCGGGSADTNGGGAHPTTTQPLAVHAVAWNPGSLDVGMVAAVAELGGDVAVFSDRGATTLAGGAISASDAKVSTWRGAATVPGDAGAGSWVLAIAGDGRVFHYRALASLEDVSDRYGLAGEPVTAIASLGGGFVGFALAKGVAIADGTTVTRYDDLALVQLAGGGGRAAGFGADGVHVLDAAKKTLTVYPLADVHGVAVAPDGHVFAITSHQLYEEDAGALVLRWDAGASILHGLVAATARAWASVDGDLATLESGVVSRAAGAGVDPKSALVPSATGDLWTIASGKLTRFGLGGPPTPDEAAWETNVLPVFARTCGQCHAPGGTSGIDLSTYDSWQKRRALIAKRVDVDKTMPPAGTAITDADRATVQAWSSAAP